MTMFSGVWPALVTAYDEQGYINTGAVKHVVSYLVEKGIDGLYVGGTTGEGVYLPVSQRKLLAETVLSAVRDRVPVIVHVGTMVVSDAVDLMRHAHDCGAAGVSSILPPQYDTADSLYAYYKAIADAVPDFPVLTYILNENRGTPALMRRLMEIPNLIGAKYTGPNMHEFRQMVELGAGRDWTMFSGMDEQCLYALMMGASGNIGSTLNYMPGVYREIRRKYEDGDVAGAQALQVRANHITAILVNSGFAGALRTAMALLGFECGEPQLPNLPLCEEARQALKRQLEESDFFELCAL